MTHTLEYNNNNTMMMNNNNNNGNAKTTTTTTITDFSPYLKFIYALNAPESKRQYPKRFKVFLDYLGIDIGNNSTIEERVNKLYYDYIPVKGHNWLATELLKFFMLQNEMAEINEISTETIRNYYKVAKVVLYKYVLQTKLYFKNFLLNYLLLEL